jgi:nicotinamidase-related amidase
MSNYFILISLLLSTITNTISTVTTPVRQYYVASRNQPVPPAMLVTEIDNKYIFSNVTFFSNHSTALILIDVWNDISEPSLFENQNLRLLPLLAFARQQKWLIIHAPSENNETSMIQVLPGELLIKGTSESQGSSSLCFPHLVNHSVTDVLIAGYDTNYCVLDKPCGTIRTSTSASNFTSTTKTKMEVFIVRDATLPQSQWFQNDYYSHITSINMIESASWLPLPNQYIRSLTVTDLILAANVPTTSQIYINATTKLKYPMKVAGSSYEKMLVNVPINFLNSSTNSTNIAFVIVSCSNDEKGMYANDGFRARVNENRQVYLEPLIQVLRRANKIRDRFKIIHIPNSHSIHDETNNACKPLPSETIANTTEDFDAWRVKHGINLLIYVGYATNRDMLFGVGGMQRYYSMSRYMGKKVPRYYWIKEATIALENEITLASGGGEWAKKQALAYRQPLVTPLGNILSWETVMMKLKTYEKKQQMEEEL